MYKAQVDMIDFAEVKNEISIVLLKLSFVLFVLRLFDKN